MKFTSNVTFNCVIFFFFFKNFQRCKSTSFFHLQRRNWTRFEDSQRASSRVLSEKRNRLKIKKRIRLLHFRCRDFSNCVSENKRKVFGPLAIRLVSLTVVHLSLSAHSTTPVVLLLESLAQRRKVSLSVSRMGTSTAVFSTANLFCAYTPRCCYPHTSFSWKIQTLVLFENKINKN